MNNSVDKILAVRYFGGECTAEETALVEEWLKHEENSRQMQVWLWEDWQETSGRMPEDMAQRLKTRLGDNIQAANPLRLAARRKWFYRVAVAATLAILVACTFFFRVGLFNGAKGGSALAYQDSISNEGLRPYKATLPDGSTVWLNSGAHVYIARDFGKKERRVKLTGEAFFDIKQDNAHPFYTTAGAVTTQVLGTAYNVEAYPGEEEVRVSLLNGKVAIHAADTTCILTPGQVALYTHASGSMTVGNFITADPAAWVTGKIVLNKIPLPEALNRLSHLYHVPIHYDYKLIQDKYIAGEFDRDTLPVVLRSVLFVHNLKFSHTKDGGYTIY
ncbi:DUF4974 domain-containing protein [Chitinophaga agrisoli]|uniref:DUF4974 domain-containing protein n=1 Tax=Chitinophaga agrisoli TaxID=2607653 RepID=A0A5B2VXM6_9BACT|nr:FecR domain-containing protein [Chitinophaga agrisoli]KAA2243360.1 DUF4974 domain-containing protein [Chitinophaga agrisoli]